MNDDFMRRFRFIDELSNKPIIPRLKRDDIGTNVTPTVHAKAVTTIPGVLISTSAKHRRERAMRIVSIFFLFKFIGTAKTNLLK